MKLKFTIFGLLCSAVIALLASCSRDDAQLLPPDPNLPEGSVYLTLKVSPLEIGSPVLPTKAPLAEENDTIGFEVPATAYEKMSTLRVIILHEDKKVEVNKFIRFNDDGTLDKPDELTFILTADETKRIYLFANEEAVDFNFNTIGLGTVMKEDEIAAIELSRPEGKPLYDNSGSEKTYIPMSEVFDVEVKKPTTEADFHQSASLFVVRAAVKFSFELRTTPDMELSQLYIESIKVNGLADKEYLLPRNTTYSPSKYEPSNLSLGGRFITSYTVPADTVSSSYTFAIPGNALAASPSPKKLVPYLYFPETGIPAGADAGYSVEVNVAGGNTMYPDFVAECKLPNLPSLPRNTHVHVVMTLAPGKSLEAQVTIMPYLSVVLNPSFGI